MTPGLSNPSPSDGANPYASPASTGLATERAAERQRRKQSFRSGHARAICAVAMMAVYSLLKIVIAGVALLAILELARTAGGGPNPARLQQLNRLLAPLALVSLPAGLLCAIAFVAWFYRAHANLPSLGNRLLSYSPGWAIGGWLIPIGNFVIPYQVMAEVWNRSIPLADVDPRRKNARGIGLVRLWWFLWLCMGILNPLSRALGVDWCFCTAAALYLPYGIISILLVLRVDANQNMRHDQVEEAAAKAPPKSIDSMFAALEENPPPSDESPEDASEADEEASADDAEPFPMPWLKK